MVLKFFQKPSFRRITSGISTLKGSMTEGKLLIS